MTHPADPSAFWQAFQHDEAALSALPLRERVERSNELLEQHVTGLALEMAGDPADGPVDLIVTAHGNVDHFPLAMQIVADAPPLQHHTVRAFRERSGDAGFSMGMDGFDLATSDVLVACDQDEGRIALTLRFAKPIPQDFADHARNMAFIMLDHVLGEYDFAVKVGAVDFVEDGDSIEGEWTGLDQFPPRFDHQWRNALGRTGVFPTGEHDWAALQIRFDAIEEREGGGDDEDGDTGVVTVNRSANAVAMRADLVHALTFEVPVEDRNSLTAATDLHDQAATLLQQPQLGILAHTLLHGEQRQAVYYVSDVALARRTLDPLLHRVPGAALYDTFDPTWSLYFEHAVHCG